MCTDTNYPSHYSTECSTGGTGQCDGYCEHGACNCSCHTALDLPETTEGVRDWHDEMEDIVASFDFVEGDIKSIADAETRAIIEVSNLREINRTTGKQFAILQGQGRVVVAERY